MMDIANNGHGSMMGGMWFISILFWVLIIAGMVFIIKWFLKRGRNKAGSGVNEESALDILEKRYARGELDRETFEQMKKDLGKEKS